MEKTYIIILVLLMITLSSCYYLKFRKSDIKNINLNNLSGKEIVSKLEELNFFDLTDSIDIEITKLEIAKSKDEHNLFLGGMREESVDFTDNRFFFIDCEELFEAGGLTIYLDEMKPIFHKLGLKLDYKNEISEQNDKYWKHSIEINNKEYQAFNGNFSMYDWGIALVNFINILNDQLQIQGNENQFYPIRVGNDGIIVLLTEKQFNFVKENYPNDSNLPKKVGDFSAF